MHTYYRSLSLFLFLVFGLHAAFSQVTLSGEVKNSEQQALAEATVSLEPIGKQTITDTEGAFSFDDINSGTYTLRISYLGYRTYEESILLSTSSNSLQIVLQEDLLHLQNVVVTGTFDPRSQLNSSTSISTLQANQLQQQLPRGTANLLQAIPGTFTDPSAGEVFTKVYTRGIAASAEDDLGWYYISLQEDGLPVSLSQHSYYSPELFHRLDITTTELEAVRGGSAAITALNGPGGIYNFISKGPSEQFQGEIQLQSGLQGEGNPLFRIDGLLSGPMGNNWFYAVGGHYRWDEGARNTDFTWSKGGQFKFNIIKKNERGYFKFYGKLLDDFTNRYTGVAATNWARPEAAFGQNFNSTALMMPGFSASIPDGRKLSQGLANSFDPSRGVHAQDFALGIDLEQDLGQGWLLRNNLKFSHKNADWQTSISNAFVSLNNPLAYFISGAAFPIGQVVFREAATGNELARIDNSGTLSGDPIQYLTPGSLPNDAIMGTSAWYKQHEGDEWIDQLTMRKTIDNHNLSMGLAAGLSSNKMFTQGSFAYVTYEPNPRMLQVSLENPASPVLALSDEHGVSNYGGLFYINAHADVRQFAIFANDQWQVSNKLYADLGLRWETIGHEGSKDRFAPFNQPGGVDGDDTTAYDNGVLAPTGEVDNFDFNYNYLSYSAGLNLKIMEEAAVFARYSKGHKAPELNYYFNNFSNVPINQKGEVQKINQAEIGIKWDLKDLSLTTTAFWSELKDIGTTNFEFDPGNNSIFYTPVQFNSSRTLGLEWESVYAPLTYLRFSFSGVLQDPVAANWTVYDAAGSVDTADDSITDYSGNQLPFNPKLMFNLGTEYIHKQFNAFFKWRYMGSRKGNVANAFKLPSYSIFDLGAGVDLGAQWSLNLLITNVFNSAGLANFFGANSFGANADGATTGFIQANPDASFVVVPVLPRGTVLQLAYRF